MTLLPESHEVRGVSRVTVKAHGARQLTFELAPGAREVTCAAAGKALPCTFQEGMLKVALPATPVDAPVSLAIGYRSAFNDRPPADAINGEDPTYGVNAAVSPEGVFLGPGAGWYPTPSSIPLKRTVRVTAPAGMESITAGKRLHRGIAHGVTSSVWEEARPTGDLSLSAGPYLIGERNLDGIPIFTYFSAANAHLAERYLEACARYIRFYEGLFGPYPFEKFAVVENFFPTGYGFPSYTLLGSTIIRLPFIPDTSLPHEICHSWWGNGVLVDYRRGNWCEGLVTYLADYYLEERESPAAGRDYRLRILTDYASLVTPDRDFPLRLFTGRVDPASRSIGYGKGAMVFHMIRGMIGDKAFFTALREVCKEKLFARASWDDFLGAFSRASGKNFTAFGEEWLNEKGGPRLSLVGVKREKAGKGWTVSGMVRQSPSAYHLQLTLLLETAGNGARLTIPVKGAETPFTFTVSAEPRRLVLDPDVDLFRILFPDEIPATVNRIKGSRSLLTVMAEDCRVPRTTIALLLTSLDQQGGEIVGENEAGPERLKGHDLLFCGFPAHVPFPPVGAPASVTRQGFRVGGELFDRPGDALFLVTRSPIDRDRVAALFYPLSAEASERSLAKITHYGKYSYLAFRGGENRAKGIVPAASAATEVVFTGGEGQ